MQALLEFAQQNLLLSLALKWAGTGGAGLRRALQVLTSGPAGVLGAHGAAGTTPSGAGRLEVGRMADLCIFDPAAAWTVSAQNLRSQGKHSPFGGHELPGRVRCTVVGGHVAYTG